MTVYRINQELLKELPPEAPADLVHAVEVTLYSEWAAAHRGSYTLVLSAPCTLNFEATEFPRTMAIQSNAYAALCLNLQRMNRNESSASLEAVLDDIAGGETFFQCRQLYNAEEYFGYLESAFGTTLPQIPSKPSAGGELLTLWTDRLTASIELNYQKLFKSCDSGSVAWQSPNYAQRDNLGGIGKLCAQRAISLLEGQLSMAFTEDTRKPRVSA